MAMRHIYNFLLYLILPFLVLRLWVKSFRLAAYRHRIPERFGYYNFKPLSHSIWVHAVSVGEAIAAIPLVKLLQQIYADTPIVVTVMTPTGAECVRNAFGASVLLLYVPYDYPHVIKRFLRQINPKILLLLETELWPNMLHYAAARKIPVILANARLSDKSYQRYQKVLPIVKPMLNNITLVAAQSRENYDRFFALGIAVEKLTLSGNIKFDLNVATETVERGIALRKLWGRARPVWIAASTHPGEEEKILTALKLVHAQVPEMLLVLVPRHPERFAAVFALCQSQNYPTVCYSTDPGAVINPAVKILLGDVMGQLLQFYAAADFAFVGGSLVKLSGHNLLEPAALAKPVLSGPNLSTFMEIKQQMLDHEALIIVQDEYELAQRIIELNENKNLCDKLGAAALDVVMQNRGATQQIISWVKKLL